MNEKNTKYRGSYVRQDMDRRLMGVSSLNPWSLHNSSSRSLMFANQLSQVLALNHTESRYILSGLEFEFAKANMFYKIPANTVILDVLEYYGPYLNKSTDEPIMIDIIYYDITLEVVEYVKVKMFDKYDKKFGYAHEYTDALRSLEPSGATINNKEIQLTRTNSEVSKGEYGFGVTLALAPVSDAVVSEDAIVISESAAHKLSFYTYETTRFSFGGDNIPLNIHGDEHEYKILRDVGEDTGDTGIIVATRNIKPDDFFPALFSYSELRDFNPTFDKVWSLTHEQGTIVDIQVIHSPKNSKYTMYDKSYNQMDAYAKAQADHRERFVERANYWIDQYRTHAGEDLHSAVIQAMKISSERTKNTYKQDPLDEYTVEVTVRYLNIPTLKHKLTTMHANKGIISEIRADSEMYVDANGIRAEIVMNPNSTMHRMNWGSKYEGFQTTATYLVDKYVKDLVSNNSLDKVYEEAHEYIVGFLKCFGNEQYDAISMLSDKQKRLYISDIVHDKFQVLLPIDNVLDHVEVYKRIKSSVYAPKEDFFRIYTGDGFERSKNKGMMEMTYIFLLNKTGETGLSVASAKLNHFGLPTAPNPELKARMGINTAPVKVISETETRLLLATVGQEPLIELRNRSLSQDSHYTVYDNILNADQPSNIDDVIDRKLHPIIGDVTTNIYSAVLNASGIKIKSKIRRK